MLTGSQAQDNHQLPTAASGTCNGIHLKCGGTVGRNAGEWGESSWPIFGKMARGKCAQRYVLLPHLGGQLYGYQKAFAAEVGRHAVSTIII